MAQNSGHPSGWKSWAISSGTTAYVSYFIFLTWTKKTETHLMQVFWISYNDLLKKYQHFDRTRLFDSHWTVVQQWTTLNVPWSADYHATKFLMTVTKGGPQVIVLSQVRRH